jgi:preprotein translocase subunit SecD
MDLTYATIVVLASMIFVLSAMIGYLYWQQTRLTQNLQSLGLVVSSLVNAPVSDHDETEPVAEPEAETEGEQEVDVPAVTGEDDRVSVEHVTKTPSVEIDLDELDSKTKAELQTILQEKGLPYSKSDKKSQLIEILKATS